MRIFLIVIVVISLLFTACIKLGSRAQTVKSGGQADAQSPPGTSGLAQTPGGLPSLETGGTSGSIGGINPPSGPVVDKPASTPISQSGSTSNQPSSSGGNIAQFNLPPGGNSQVGALPPSQGGAQPPANPSSQPPGSGMAGFANNQPGSAGARPYFEKGGDLTADTMTVNLREPVFLTWKVANARSLTLDLGNGSSDYPQINQPGHFVRPDTLGERTYTLRADNEYGSVSQQVSVQVVTQGQRQAKYKLYVFNRCRTFLAYPATIRKGETVYVYWNVLDAQNVILINSLTNDLTGIPPAKDIVTTSGVFSFQPPASLKFRLLYGDGTYLPPGTAGSNYEYQDCSVTVIP